VACQYMPWAQWADACSHTRPKQPREWWSNKSTAAVADQGNEELLEDFHLLLACTVPLPPQASHSCTWISCFQYLLVSSSWHRFPCLLPSPRFYLILYRIIVPVLIVIVLERSVFYHLECVLLTRPCVAPPISAARPRR
jgi:hypothetical protein